MERQSDPYFVLRPDGLWEDTRYEFKRGDRVTVLEGHVAGRTGTVESCVAQIYDGQQWVTEVGYHIVLDKEVAGRRVFTVRWDAVEAV
ncbi:hypothetical protein ACFLX9_02575 [Chloroflexota bacterium]